MDGYTVLCSKRVSRLITILVNYSVLIRARLITIACATPYIVLLYCTVIALYVIHMEDTDRM